MRDGGLATNDERPVCCQMNLVLEDMDATLALYRRLGLDIPDTEPAWQAHHRRASMPDGLSLDFDRHEFVEKWNQGSRVGGPKGACAVGFRRFSREAVEDLNEDLTNVTRPWQVIRQLLRIAMLVSARVREWRIVRRTPLHDAMKWIRSRLQPWMTRTVLVDAVHDVNGVQMRIPPPRDATARSGEFQMALGTYEDQELGYVLARLRPGDVFVDVGAHVG